MTAEDEPITMVQRVTLLVPFKRYPVDAERAKHQRARDMPSEWDWTTLIDSFEPVIVVDASPEELP